MKLLREFFINDEKFTVSCTDTDLNVISPRGVLNYPVAKYAYPQKRQIFESQVPEHMASRELTEASHIIIHIEAGAANA